MPPEVRSQALSDLANLGISLEAGAGGAGGGMARGLAQGFSLNYPALTSAIQGTQGVAQNAMVGSEFWLAQQGVSILTGLTSGMKAEQPNMSGWITNLSGVVAAAASAAGTWLNPSGASVMAGMAGGMNGNLWQVSNAAGSARGAAEIGSLYGNAYGSGASIGSGLADGIWDSIGRIQRAVDAAMSAVAGAFPHSPAKRGPFSGSGWTRVLTSGAALGKQFTDGLRQGIEGSVDHAMRAADLSATASSIGADQTGAGSSPLKARGDVNLTINNPVVRDLKSEAWEAAQTAGVLI
jgi:hypothetical protein